MRFRAISPVVATTLLIIIAVVTAVVLYLWVSGTVQNQPTQQAQLQAAIRIEEVNLSGGNITEVYVRNVGDIPVSISNVYIIDGATGNTIYALNSTVTIDSLKYFYFFNVSNTTNNAITVVKPGELAIVHLYTRNITDRNNIQTWEGVNISGHSVVIVKVVTDKGIEATYVVTVRE